MNQFRTRRGNSLACRRHDRRQGISSLFSSQKNTDSDANVPNALPSAIQEIAVPFSTTLEPSCEQTIAASAVFADDHLALAILSTAIEVRKSQAPPSPDVLQAIQQKRNDLARRLARDPTILARLPLLRQVAKELERARRQKKVEHKLMKSKTIPMDTDPSMGKKSSRKATDEDSEKRFDDIKGVDEVRAGKLPGKINNVHLGGSLIFSVDSSFASDDSQSGYSMSWLGFGYDYQQGYELGGCNFPLLVDHFLESMYCLSTFGSPKGGKRGFQSGSTGTASTFEESSGSSGHSSESNSILERMASF